jgi:hypothetical protein
LSGSDALSRGSHCPIKFEDSYEIEHKAGKPKTALRTREERARSAFLRQYAVWTPRIRSKYIKSKTLKTQKKRFGF